MIACHRRHPHALGAHEGEANARGLTAQESRPGLLYPLPADDVIPSWYPRGHTSSVEGDERTHSMKDILSRALPRQELDGILVSELLVKEGQQFLGKLRNVHRVYMRHGSCGGKGRGHH